MSHNGLAAGFQRPLINAVTIIHVQVDRRGHGSELGGRPSWVAHHDGGITDSHDCVHDRTIFAVETDFLLGLEGGFGEIEQPGNTGDEEVGCDGQPADTFERFATRQQFCSYARLCGAVQSSDNKRCGLGIQAARLHQRHRRYLRQPSRRDPPELDRTARHRHPPPSRKLKTKMAALVSSSNQLGDGLPISFHSRVLRTAFDSVAIGLLDRPLALPIFSRYAK